LTFLRDFSRDDCLDNILDVSLDDVILDESLDDILDDILLPLSELQNDSELFMLSFDTELDLLYYSHFINFALNTN